MVISVYFWVPRPHLNIQSTKDAQNQLPPYIGSFSIIIYTLMCHSMEEKIWPDHMLDK